MKKKLLLLFKKFNGLLGILTCLAMLFVISTCSKDDPIVEPDDEVITDNLDKYISTLPELEQPAESSYQLIDEDTIIEGNYVCHSETYSGAPGFSEMLFSRTNTDVLYPGALLNGESVLDGSYTLCNLARAPITITVNLQNLDGEISRTIEKPAFSTIQSAINDILSQEVVGDAGAEMSFTLDEVYSESHMKAGLGINCELANVFDVGGDLNFEMGTKYQRVIAKFSQKYYDIIIDQPLNPCEFLDMTSLSESEVMTKVGETSPAYISSVSYGRYALFYFETTDLEMKLEAELEAKIPIAVDGGTLKLGGKAEFESMMKSGNVTCKAYILGGSGEDAAKAINSADEFINYVQNGGKYSKDSPGKPISFTLRYLCNNKPLRLVMASDYEQTTCSKAANKYRITLVDLSIKRLRDLSFNQIDLYGTIKLTPGGLGNPTGGGDLFSGSRKTVHKDNPYEVGSDVIVEFETLTESQRKEAYIEFDVSSLKSNNIDYFDPKKIRIYLHELAEGEGFEVKTSTYWHELILKYNVEILD